MSGKKVLIVDDDPVIVKGLTFKLRSKGYKILSAAEGSAAIKLVLGEDPDLLIVDINFSTDVANAGGLSCDGFAILQWLQRLNEAWRKPVIIITGEESPQGEAKAQAAGAVAFFRKPVNHEELLKAIRQALGGVEPAAAPPSA